MNAEIFYHPNQEANVQAIAALIAKRIYPGIEVARMQAVNRPGLWDRDGAYPRATRYVQLLLASIPPDRGIGIGVQWLYYGFYIYSSYFGQYRSFQQEGAGDLFPAVAVNDRMVLIPEKLGNRLTGSEGLSPFRPLEGGGVLEVDFNQPELLDKALLKIGEMLRAEAVQMVRQYSTYHPGADGNIKDAALALGFDAPFVEEALKQQAGRNTFYGQLTCEFDRTDFPVGRWTRVKVKIANPSDVGLHGLSVDIRGPVRVRPSRLETDLPAHGSAQIDIALEPQEEGEFPIEVVFTLAEDRALKDWLPVTEVWLTTRANA
ncbi:MAG: hypothetical protein ABI165_02080 [Bryobacteraceae bacterium]